MAEQDAQAAEEDLRNAPAGVMDANLPQAPADNPPVGPKFPQPKPGDFAPGTLAWRIAIARRAHEFFNPLYDRRTMAELGGRKYNPDTIEAWSVGNFMAYLPKAGFLTPNVQSVVLLLSAMERAGLLAPAGWDPRMVGQPWVGQLYISHAGPSPRASQSSLWLAEVLGAELLIPAYNLVSVLITAGEGVEVGTGLVLDRTHVVTNRHVVEGLIGAGNAGYDIEVHPSFKQTGAVPLSRPSRVLTHPSIDVALIEAQLADNEHLIALPGMTFRDPKWHDEVCVHGYPYVPGLTERPITVERGHIKHPETDAAGVDGYLRQKTFLTSAIARPGNSGGPIVAQDGCVVGLVVRSGRLGATSASAPGPPPAQQPDSKVVRSDSRPPDEDPDSPPFYRGIPASLVVQAIEELSQELGVTGLAVLENQS